MFAAQNVFLLVFKQYFKLTLCFVLFRRRPSNVGINLCQRRQQPFLETALRLRLNIHFQGSTRFFSTILNLTEFLFLLTSEIITPEVKTYKATHTDIRRCLMFLMLFVRKILRTVRFGCYTILAKNEAFFYSLSIPPY